MVRKTAYKISRRHVMDIKKEYKKLASIINQNTIVPLRTFFIEETFDPVTSIELLYDGKRKVRVERSPLRVIGNVPYKIEETVSFPFVFLMDDGSKDYKTLLIKTEDLGRLITIGYDRNFKIMLDGKVRTYIAYLQADTYEIEVTKLPEELEE